MNGKLKFIRIILVSLLISCLPACFAQNTISYDVIRDVAWDKDNVLFSYDYVKQTLPSGGPLYTLEAYRVPLSRFPSEPLEALKLTTDKDVFSFFETAWIKFIREHLDELKPDFQDPSSEIVPNTEYFASYLNQNGLLLSGHVGENAGYYLINTRDNKYKKLRFSAQTQSLISPEGSGRFLIKWIGLDNYVLVGYKKNGSLYYGRAMIDIASAELKDLIPFKEHKASEAHGPDPDFFVANKFEYPDVKVLGWDSPESVYYLEKPAGSNGIKLFRQNIASGTTEQLAIMDREKSYYKFLRNYSQVSIAQKKVAYVVIGESTTDQDIYVSNLDGTNQKLLVSRKKDLPIGLRIRLN